MSRFSLPFLVVVVSSLLLTTDGHSQTGRQFFRVEGDQIVVYAEVAAFSDGRTGPQVQRMFAVPREQVATGLSVEEKIDRALALIAAMQEVVGLFGVSLEGLLGVSMPSVGFVRLALDEEGRLCWKFTLDLLAVQVMELERRFGQKYSMFPQRVIFMSSGKPSVPPRTRDPAAF